MKNPKHECRIGDEFWVYAGSQAQFQLLQNLDGINRDRYPNPQGFSGNPSQLISKYIQRERLVVVQGIYLEDSANRRFDARIINLLQSANGEFLFEESHC